MMRDVVVLVVKVIVGLVLLLYSILLVIPDQPVMRVIKAGHSPTINRIGNMMHFTGATFANLSYAHWVGWLN